MTITTKYEIGQKVYFMDENKKKIDNFAKKFGYLKKKCYLCIEFKNNIQYGKDL